MAEHVYMHSGPSIRVKLRIGEDRIGELVDWFGKDFRITDNADGVVTVSLNCNESAMFYWALQYGTVAEVLQPVELRERLRQAAEEMGRKYSD